MKNFLRSILSPWTALVVGALIFVVLLDVFRARQVEHVTAIGDEPTPLADGALGTGGEWRSRLIVPDHDNTSLAWLCQTRKMLISGESRVRHIEFENAPFGREVFATSPYRWWLALLASARHTLTGTPWGQSLEWTALWANPLLQALLLVLVAGLVAWRFGAFSAAVSSMLIALLFPLGAEFLPGLPRDGALSQITTIGSALLLLAGLADERSGRSRIRIWFAASGVVGGLGLWVSIYRGVPVLGGIGLGALLAAWVSRKQAPEAAGIEPGLWRVWALAGAVTTLGAYLVEFGPDYLGLWHTRAIHPLYALAWLGGGELLVITSSWLTRRPGLKPFKTAAWLVSAVAAIAALPVTMRLTKSWGFWATDMDQLRLAHFSGAPSAANSFSWIIHDGLSGEAWAALLPLLLIAPAIWWLVRRESRASERQGLALALGVVAVQLGYACRWLDAWNSVGAALVVLGVILAGLIRTTARPKLALAVALAVLAVVVTPGAIQVMPRRDPAGANALAPREIFGLIERDLGRWLAVRANQPAAVVVAPHNLSATLHYYGGLRGISSLAWENADGLGVVIRIASASTPEEAHALLKRRQVRCLVMPSWDAYLDVYAGIGMGELDGTFLKDLHDWKLPLWLRPVPYALPQIPGFEGESVTILELVEDQDDAVALSRLAEYFIEMNQLDRAATIAVGLRRFPADFSALVARAQVDFARQDQAAFGRSLALLKPRLTSRGAVTLAWDRRVSLAVVLAQAKLHDEAREQVQRCLAEMDEGKLRALSTGAIYRLLVLSRNYSAPFPNPNLRAVALTLVPADLRARVE